MASSVPSWCTNSSAELAGEHHVEPGEARCVGVGRAGQLPDLPSSASSFDWACGGGLVGGGDGGLLLVELDLGLVDLLGDDLQLVAGVGDELGGLGGAGGVAGRRGGTAGRAVTVSAAAAPTSRPERIRPSRRGGAGGGEQFRGVLQFSVRGRHGRRLSVSSSATAYRVS